MSFGRGGGGRWLPGGGDGRPCSSSLLPSLAVAVETGREEMLLLFVVRKKKKKHHADNDSAETVTTATPGVSVPLVTLIPDRRDVAVAGCTMYIVHPPPQFRPSVRDRLPNLKRPSGYNP